MIGTKWEKNGAAINYVFRWDKQLVEQVTSSYLGLDIFENLSFSFWHHNIIFVKLVKLFGQKFGLLAVKGIKGLLDTITSRNANQFCGCMLKK